VSKFKELLTPKRIPSALLIVLAILLLALPVFGKDYYLYAVIRILILALFAFSVNLLLGYTGLLSFGQGAFYAAGAFTCARILLARPNLLLGIICGVVIAGAVAFILGWFSVRHTAMYFAMLTLAFGMMIFGFLQKLKITGGAMGLWGIPRAPLEIPYLFSISMKSMSSYYYFVLILSSIAIFIFYRLVHSPLGLTFQGIRDSESRIAFTGISVRNTRWLCFVIAGMYAGLAGALLAPLEGAVSPQVSHWATSGDPVMATLLGGMYTFSGPIAGAAIYFMLKEYAVGVAGEAMNWMLILGAVMVALVLGLRGGIVGSLQQSLFPRLRARFAERSSHEQNDIKH